MINYLLYGDILRRLPLCSYGHPGFNANAYLRSYRSAYAEHFILVSCTVLDHLDQAMVAKTIDVSCTGIRANSCNP